MGYDEHAHAFAGEFQNHFQDFAHHFGVECGGNFVQKDDFRIQAQGADDGDALFLAAGEFARIGVFAVEQADAFQQFVGLCLCFGTVAVLYFHRA